MPLPRRLSTPSAAPPTPKLDEPVEIMSRGEAAYKCLLDLRRLRDSRTRWRRFIAEGQLFLRMRPRTVFVRESRWREAAPELCAALAQGGEEGPSAFMDTSPFDWGGGPLADGGKGGAAPRIAVLRDELFDRVSTQEKSQGLLCIFAIPGSGQYGGQLAADDSCVVVLDRVMDPNNLGVILRTMEAFGAAALVVTKGTVDVYNDKVVRCSMGAVMRGKIRVLAAEDATELGQLLRGYRIFATALSGQLQPMELGRHLSGRDALIFGNEAEGVTPEVLQLADERVRIPMVPGVDSLNVGIAVGIVLHAAVASGIGGPSLAGAAAAPPAERAVLAQTRRVRRWRMPRLCF